MQYETLLIEADNHGIHVRELPLRANKGRIYNNRIAIKNDIDTYAEKACVLVEELGHYYTTVGNILDLSKPEYRKQELKDS